jgi:hypothetical protein
MKEMTEQELAQARISANSDYFMSRFCKHAAARGVNFQNADQAAQAAIYGYELANSGQVRPLAKSAGERAPLVLDQDDEAGLCKVAQFIDAVVDSVLAGDAAK